jgi:GTP cyclohydrolase I
VKAYTLGQGVLVKPDRNRLATAYAEVLNTLGLDGLNGTANTARRAASALIEMTEGYTIEPESLFQTFDADGYDQLIAVGPCRFASLCEHHLLPFVGSAWIVYLPRHEVLGLSKLPRLVDVYARRLQIQERMTQQIADAVWEGLKPHGVLVVVDAEHICATLRGVKKEGMLMRTAALHGSLKDDAEQRAEAYRLIAR